MKKVVYFALLLSLCGCSLQKTLRVSYIKEGEILNDKIPIKGYLSDNKRIKTIYLDSINFAILDSISFKDNNPDRMIDFSTPVNLDFSKRIKKYSPEYYSIGTVHYITKCMIYYDNLFNKKIRFNTQDNYKSNSVLFGDVPLITTPKKYIFERNSPFSPSIFFHEIGHRAFWLIESDLGIKFNGLSYVHMGLLEYFTVSLNNSPIVGELGLPKKLVRNGKLSYNYPIDDSLYLGRTLQLLKESYKTELMDSTRSISRYYNLTMKKYGSVLNKKIDNHRSGLIITSTLWRIREILGQEKTDNLIAGTILDLNKYMNGRKRFYIADSNEELPDYICWYDLYFGLLDKDREIFNGANKELIKSSFKLTGFPVEKVKYDR